MTIFWGIGHLLVFLSIFKTVLYFFFFFFFFFFKGVGVSIKILGTCILWVL